MNQLKTVVITGASAGLGRAIAHVFAETGARVGLISRDQAALDATAVEVEKLGGTAAVYAADVSDDAAVEAPEEDCILANLLSDDHSHAEKGGIHCILLEPYGYRWYRVCGLDYLLKRSDA